MEGGHVAEARATVLRASDGSVVVDARFVGFSAVRHVVAGMPGVPLPTSSFGSPDVYVVASSTGLLPAGTLGYEQWMSCASGTCNDLSLIRESASGGSLTPVFGDSSIGGFGGAAYVDSTTLFWVRGRASAAFP
jgi:hypothetical protein